MKVSGIIAEYNPFHNGHKYHIEQTKLKTDSYVAVIMSGSLVQRGEFAAFSKHMRAHAALLNGADLVLELPCIYSAASAQRFASGAAAILDSLGVIDYLSFGSESGNLNSLSRAAEISQKLDKSKVTAQFLKTGMSYPAAKRAAMEKLYGNADIIDNPNDTLGIEYLCALKELDSKIEPIAVKREHIMHDSAEASGGFASASFIRSLIGKSVSADDLFPENIRALYNRETESGHYKIDPRKFDIAAMYALKSLSPEDFSNLPDVSEGLENRLYESAQRAVSTDEFLSLVKTKRYTLARLRRIVIYALMGITKSDQRLKPSYVRVLGLNDNGKKILAKARKKSSIDFYTSFAKIEKSGGRIAQLDRKSTDLHNHLSITPLSGGRDFYDNAIILNSEQSPT